MERNIRQAHLHTRRAGLESNTNHDAIGEE